MYVVLILKSYLLKRNYKDYLPTIIEIKDGGVTLFILFDNNTCFVTIPSSISVILNLIYGRH